MTAANQSMWTLFLDRDGVINKRNMSGYITRIDDFYFLEGVLEAIPLLNKHFQRIIIVTNQAGVGKELMTESDLDQIHRSMLERIESKGGKIDAALSCTQLATMNPNCRKPSPSMAMEAFTRFPDIDTSKLVMVGDEQSDMLFGRNIGAINILIDHQYPHLKDLPGDLVDYKFADLKSTALAAPLLFR